MQTLSKESLVYHLVTPSDKIKKQIRKTDPLEMARKHTYCVVFFVSSAGFFVVWEHGVYRVDSIPTNGMECNQILRKAGLLN
jgi:hypothetical protein